jgi:hypothetical protein
MPVTARGTQLTYNEACDLAMRDMYRAFHVVASDIMMPLAAHEIAAVIDFYS